MDKIKEIVWSGHLWKETTIFLRDDWVEDYEK